MIFNSAKRNILSGSIDLLVDDIKVMLLNSVHVTNIDTQEFISDVSANEISGTNYTAGGKLLINKTVTKEDANDRAVFRANNATWENSNFTGARYAVIYKDTGTPATSPLISVIDLGSDQASTGGYFTIEWNPLGIILTS